MSTITLAKDFGYTAYRVSGLASGTVIDASDASWILDNNAGDGKSDAYPVLVYKAPNVVIQGGTIVGNIDLKSDWAKVYAMGNSAAIRTEDAPNATIRDWHISNSWDAVRVSWNSPNFVIEDIWATNIRDDAVENDRLQSGTIRDSLFDGAFSGISVDPDNANPIDGRKETVVIDGVLMRLQKSLYEGEMTHSSFIKTDSATNGAVTPNLRFVNNVFALEDVNHHSYRSMFDAWAHTVESKNNYFLNLSNVPLPKGYPLPPSGWTVLQGQAARDYWAHARDAWIARHADGSTAAPGGVPVPVPTPVPSVPDINETISGSAGNDTMLGHAGNDSLVGNGGNDKMDGGAGNDSLYGGDGNDNLKGGLGNDRLDGGAGSDTADFTGTAAVKVNLALTAAQATGHGTDTLLNIEHVTSGSGADRLTGNTLANSLISGAGNDTLNGGAGNDSLAGGDGNDNLTGGLGNDRLDGGAGTDTADFTGTAAVTVNLSLTAAQATGHGTDTLISIENVTSGSGADRLTGNTLANTLISGAGNDTVNGGAGNDVIYGGDGNDSLTGGSGADLFVFNTALRSGNIDRITDFSHVDDTVRLENAFFTGLANGTLSSGAFRANTTGLAADSSDRIIYETDTGKLFFDADGNGAGAHVQFATLNAGLTITNADFFVI